MRYLVDDGEWWVRTVYLPPNQLSEWQVSLVQGDTFDLAFEDDELLSLADEAFESLQDAQRNLFGLLTTIQEVDSPNHVHYALSQAILRVLDDSGVISLMNNLSADFWQYFFESNLREESKERVYRDIIVWSDLINSFVDAALLMLDV